MAGDLSDIHRALGRIEGTLKQIDGKIDTAHSRMDKQDGRLWEMEKMQSHAAGRNSILGSIAGMIGGALAAWFGRHI